MNPLIELDLVLAFYFGCTSELVVCVKVNLIRINKPSLRDYNSLLPLFHLITTGFRHSIRESPHIFSDKGIFPDFHSNFGKGLSDLSLPYVDSTGSVPHGLDQVHVHDVSEKTTIFVGTETCTFNFLSH